MSSTTTVTTAEELLHAIQTGAKDIAVNGVITGMPMITLSPGVRLHGGTLHFGAKGVRLTRDNELSEITISTQDHEVAVLNDTTVDDLGILSLRDVRTHGQVLLLAQDNVRAGHVEVEGLTVVRADVRGRVDRPRGFGVEALQGAFTLWNRQPDPAVTLTAKLLDISAGTVDRPVRGSGVFVGGHGDWDGAPDGGTIQISLLRTGAIHTNGGIALGTPDLISGGVFVISGAVVDQVTNSGTVTTSGQNDMVLDNWGEVNTWTALAPITSSGPSGIGFVNFGKLGSLDVRASIETFGPGARGFNLYDGSMERAKFESIATHGDGSIGVQESKMLPVLEITRDLTTEGGEGQSLVKGVQTSLKAIALSVKAGGSIGSVFVGGTMRTAGDNVTTLEVEGQIGKIQVDGGIVAQGKNSNAVHRKGAALDLSNVKLLAADGDALVQTT